MGDVKYDAFYRQDPRTCGDPFPAFVAHADAVGGPGVRVLDLGCGQGRDAVVFARRGCRVLGVDVSAVGVEQLNATARREGLDLEARVGDIRDLDGLDGFDVVLLDRVLHMLASDEERVGVLAAAMGATAPGGDVLVADEPTHAAMIRRVFVDAGWHLIEEARATIFARKPGAAGGGRRRGPEVRRASCPSDRDPHQLGAPVTRPAGPLPRGPRVPTTTARSSSRARARPRRARPPRHRARRVHTTAC